MQLAEPQPKQRLAGKVAIITGAARGIGRAVTQRFAAEGAVVYGVDVITDELSNVCQDLRDQGYDVTPLVANVAEAEAVAALVQQVLAERQRIDVLANVAGVIIQKTTTETTPEDFDRIIAINLRGPFLLARAVATSMIAAGQGSIINVSSRAGVRGGAREIAYCASKFGIEGLSRALAQDLGRHGIAVNSITPGIPTHTSMSETTYDAETRKIWRDPAEIAPAFVHLALQTPAVQTPAVQTPANQTPANQTPAVQTPAGIHDQYVNAWELSETLREVPG